MKKPGARQKAQDGRGRGKWEDVPLGEEFLSNKEFENLISVEILSDYNLVRDEDEKASEVSGGLKRKRKELDKQAKKKSKSLKFDEDSNAVQINSPGSKSPWIVTDLGDSNEKEDNQDAEQALSAGSPAPWVAVTEMTSEVDDQIMEPEGDEQLEIAERPRNVKSKKQKKSGKPVRKNVDVVSESEDISEEDGSKTTVNYNEVMSSWSKLGTPLPVLKALYEKKFMEPTPIQTLTLPSSVLGKKDIVGAAETGSGKTLAFAIPIISGILQEQGNGDDDRFLKALIITPTRELAAQVQNHIKDAAKYTNIQTVLIVGGLAAQKQERLLRRNPEIVIATPGRLWELVREGNEHLSSLSQIKFLAIDETDRMAEKGHFQELEGILAAVNSDPDCASKRQNFVFSATLAFTHEPPQRLKKMSLKTSKNKQQPKKQSSKEKLRQIMDMVGVREGAKIVDITQKKGTCETLTEMQILCQLMHKDYYLYYFFLRHPGRTIVFCNSINCVRRLTNLFLLLNFEPLALHSDMHQKQRLKNLERFTAHDDGILIATDVAARGLDIVDVQHVIHYQVPKTAETYIHRSGRTARAFKGGIAILIAEPAEATQMKNIMRSLKREETLPIFEVDSKIFREVKERVDMAVKVEKFEHQVRKKFADMNWMDKAKKEMDLYCSDESSDDDDVGSGEKGMKKNMEKAKKELELNKRRLEEMLSANLFLNRPVGDVRTTFQKLAAVKTKAL